MTTTLLRALSETPSPGVPHALQVLDCAACPLFPAPAPIPIVVGVVLVIGIIISYFFQFLSFYRLQSSKGISSFSLGLALLSSLLTFTNFLILHWKTIICCACVSYGRCMAANMTPLQLFANVLCLLFVYSSFLWYYPLEPFSIFRQQRKREYLRARVLLVIVLLVSIIFSATSATLYYGLNLSTKTLGLFGRAIGILSALVVIVQWTPQIFTTFQLGSAGSLSVVMLLIQLPGCLLTVFFQAVIGGADITTWGPYLVSAINIMILIIMCTVFWIRNRNGVSEDNFDILLSEDEHHVYEYDQDAGNLARKSYGSFSMIPPPSNFATPVSVSATPHSGKLAWSLSDRNGFKGKLSAATFITSGTTTRTRAHLSGKDLLGKSRPVDSFMAGLDESFGKDMFARWDGESSDGGSGTVQPPPDRSRRRQSTSHHSQKYIGGGVGGATPSTSSSVSTTQIQPGTSHDSSLGATPSNHPYVSSSVGHRGGKVIATPKNSRDGHTSLSATPSRSLQSGSQLRPAISNASQPSSPSQFGHLLSVSPNTKGNSSEHASPANSYSATSSFSNSMSVVEQLGGSFLVAPPPSPNTATHGFPAIRTLSEDIIESDADDINFTEDPLNRDGPGSLDTPQNTLDRERFAQAQSQANALALSPSSPTGTLTPRSTSSSTVTSPQNSLKVPAIHLTATEDSSHPDEQVVPLDPTA